MEPEANRLIDEYFFVSYFKKVAMLDELIREFKELKWKYEELLRLRRKVDQSINLYEKRKEYNNKFEYLCNILTENSAYSTNYEYTGREFHNANKTPFVVLNFNKIRYYNNPKEEPDSFEVLTKENI